jgi:hypothetical protein
MNFAPKIKWLIVDAGLNEDDICVILDQEDAMEIPYIKILKEKVEYNEYRETDEYSKSLESEEYKKSIDLLANKALLLELKFNALEEALDEFSRYKSKKTEIKIQEFKGIFKVRYSDQIANIIRVSIPIQEYLANLSKDQMANIDLRNRQEQTSILENRHIWDSILAKEFSKMSKSDPICSNLILQKWGEKKEYDKIKKDIENSTIISNLFRLINTSIVNLRQKFSRCQKELLKNVVKSYRKKYSHDK